MRDVISIQHLNQYVKTLLDRDEVLSGIALRGEITNFVRHTKSGHLYFSLRDEAASVKAVMFARDARQLAFRPEEGMRVIVRCRVSLYEATGAFQVYVSDLFPDGVGAAQMAFEQLKARLEYEGLFRSDLKKPLPERPSYIGVVTSATGAALQDIKNVLQRRWPLAKLLLAPVNVQGMEAAKQIAAGIRSLERDGRANVIIVARGGGSREDLWVFNDEGIARAAFACTIPLISAVGHEIDFSILDFVADMRAPTPSAAAELATPDIQEEMQKLFKKFVNIQENIHYKRDLWYTEFTSLQAKRSGCSPQAICQAQQAKLARISGEATLAIKRVEAQKQNQLSATVALAHSLSPYQVLSRGYAMVQSETGEHLAIETLAKGQTIRITGNDACALCKVEQVQHNTEANHEKAEEL